jgi:hypothetical protein
LVGDESRENRQDGDLQRVVNAAHEELRRLLGDRSQLTTRIATAKKTLTGLATMFGDEVLNEEIRLLLGRPHTHRKRGLTAACRSVLIQAGGQLTANEVHDRLSQEYPALLEHHRHPISAIRMILARLERYGEAQTSNERGRRTWASTEDSEPRADTLTPSDETS